MRANFADLAVCDVKFREPKDSAAASPLEEDAVAVDGRSGTVVGVVSPAVGTEETLCEAPCRGGFCLRSCKALARAFSCVRTKVASCYGTRVESVSCSSCSTPGVSTTMNMSRVRGNRRTFMNSSPSSESMIISWKALGTQPVESVGAGGS